MVWGKQWCLGLAAIVVVVAAFGSLVGVTCWHMAYQEASLEAAIREQRTLDFAKKRCVAYVAKALQQRQPSTTIEQTETNLSTNAAQQQTTVTSPPVNNGSLPAKEEHLGNTQTRKVMLGMLTSQDVMMYAAQEGIQDLIQGGLITLQPHLVLPLRQPQETLVDYVTRLHQDLGVRVFVGGQTEKEVRVVAVWARARLRPRQPVVLVLPSAPTGWWPAASSLKRDLESDFAVVSITPPVEAALSATLLQMRERGLRRVLPLLPDTAAANILATQLTSWNFSSLNMKILRPVRYDVSMPAEQVVAAAGHALQTVGSDGVGVLLTASPNLADLVTAADEHQLSHVPWFIAANNLPNLLDIKKSLLGNIDLNAVRYENPVYSVDRNENISKRVQDKVKSTHKVSIAQVYDAVIVASRVGYWLTRDDIPSLTEVLQRVSWESSTWAGLTGVLELTENLERSQGCFIFLHLAVEDSVTWESTGRTHFHRTAHTITLASSSADTIVIHEEEKHL